MSNKLTKKQKEFTKSLAKNGNGTKAALKAYNTVSSKNAASIASRNLQKPKIQTSLEEEMAKQGITLSKALKPISKGLKATRRNENGKKVDDLDTQLKASDRALKLLLPKEKADNNLSFNFNIDSARFGGEFVIDGGTA